MKTFKLFMALMLLAGLALSVGPAQAQEPDPSTPGAWIIYPDATPDHWVGNDRHSDTWGSDLSTSIHEALGYSGQYLCPGPSNSDICYWEFYNPPPEGSIIELRGGTSDTGPVWDIGGDGAQGGDGREKMKSLVMMQNGITIRGQDYDDGSGNMVQQEILFNNGGTTALFYCEAKDLTLENLHITGTWPTNSGGYAIAVGRYTILGPEPTAPGLTVKDCTMENLRAPFDQRPTLEDVTIVDNVVNDAYYNIFKKGVTFTGDNTLTGNTFNQVGEGKTYPALQILGNEGTICIDDNTFNGWRVGEYAIYVENDATTPVGVGENNTFVDQGGGTYAAFNDYALSSGHAVGWEYEGDVTACEEPTAIDLAAFSAEAGADGVALAWETATEVDNAGFNLYRALLEDGPYTQVNGALIAAQGDAMSGASYSFLDAPGYGTYYYKLEDVDYHGVSTMHGPVQVTVARPLRRPLYRPAIPEF